MSSGTPLPMNSMDDLTYVPEARREHILELLRAAGFLRVSSLAEQLGVTPVTIRRDVKSLVDEGKVVRIRGGVTLSEDPSTIASSSPRVTAPERSIGMVVPRLDYYWPEVVRGAEEMAAQLGLRVVLRESAYDDVDEDLAQMRHLVETEGVDGLLLTVNMNIGADRLITAVQGWNIPTTLVERRLPEKFSDTDIDSVTSNHELGATLAVRHLVELGHSRVGIVIGRGGATGPVLHQGWIHACESEGIAATESVNVTTELAKATAADRSFDEIIDACQRTGTTALIIHADAEANGFVQECQRRGIRVPGDISVVAYDDQLASLFAPPLSAVRPPRTSVGSEAVRLLASRMDDAGWPSRRVLISPRLYTRSSSGAPHAGKH